MSGPALQRAILAERHSTETQPRQFTAEQRFLVAIIRVAIADARGVVQGRDRVRRNTQLAIRRDAQLWLSSASDDPFSFRWVAAHLGVDIPRDGVLERVLSDDFGVVLIQLGRPAGGPHVPHVPKYANWPSPPNGVYETDPTE